MKKYIISMFIISSLSFALDNFLLNQKSHQPIYFMLL
jgi:hypothetical protein